MEELSKVIKVIDAIRKETEPNIPLQQVKSFLQVCMMQGKGVRQIGEANGSAEGSRSRNLRALSDTGLSVRTANNGRGRKGFNLIRLATSDTDFRAKKTYLTNKGKVLLNTITDILEEGVS